LRTSPLLFHFLWTQILSPVPHHPTIQRQRSAWMTSSQNEDVVRERVRLGIGCYLDYLSVNSVYCMKFKIGFSSCFSSISNDHGFSSHVRTSNSYMVEGTIYWVIMEVNKFTRWPGSEDFRLCNVSPCVSIFKLRTIRASFLRTRL